MNLSSKLVRFGTILVALIGLASVFMVSRTQAEREMPKAENPPVNPPPKPFTDAVAATGILEALSENVTIGVPSPGLVTEVFVKVNDSVKKGDRLFSLDDRELQAERLSSVAQQKIDQAQVGVSEAQLAKAAAQYQRISSVGDSQAFSRDDVENRRQDVDVYKAQLEAAKASLAATETSLKRIDLLISRLTVRAPRDGTIIQMNIRAGEYAATSPQEAPMILGDTDKLQVRADVDEQNAIRIRPGQQAYGYLKGDPSVTFPLHFIRVEPYVIPKVSLTGASTERVDTRVLQVIYSLDRPENPPLYVGQQVDIFIEAPES
ncbi:efflux RND transporter periplasmic adaptor subunit [Luteolibacter pohnpeiensis]|uniref:Efflux RND transporter periplasmic adaptor subunit n=1 Tax=Luteolibacter pohnpeiensis TaxID=454153 RepID=A0A934VV03_9BACT|nr:efflux RND transporter periplasmic adaptor subunit [Luteolibacter pohnpeiensis]MBK1883072.1 efflux RND transporter periplasmic adaptor subunit [Luteolibacter pohnpeiensis]